MCLRWRRQQRGLLQGLRKPQSPVGRMLGLHLEPPPARQTAARHTSLPAGLPGPPSQTSSAGQSAASERTTLIHEEAEAEPAQQQPPAEQGASPDGPAQRQQAAPGPREGGLVSRWRRRMSTSERLPDVLTQEPQVAQALAPPQMPPPVDAKVCVALPALPTCWPGSTSAPSSSVRGVGNLFAFLAAPAMETQGRPQFSSCF